MLPEGAGDQPSRRAVLGLGAGSAGLVVWSAVLRSRTRGGDALDAALERLHAGVSNDEHFLSNHVPMCVEALSVLGRADAIPRWLEDHLEPVAHDPHARRPVDPDRWRDALGRKERFQDWRAFFLDALRNEDWARLLRRWTPRLAPGFAASATHGAIRTAHAARGLAARDNTIRRVELGTALAYWASRYETLPWDGALAPAPSVAAALAKARPRRPGLAPPRGNILTGLRALQGTPSFAALAGRVKTSDPHGTLSEMTSAFAKVFLRNPAHRVVLTHAVTAPSAVRLLAPYVADEALEALTRYAWQAAAGLYVVYHDPQSELPPAKPALAREELVARAVASGDAHTVKLTEACLREQAVAPDPARLEAARDAVEATWNPPKGTR